MASPLVQPFSLTYVVYPVGDTFGELFALLSLAPVFIIVALATLLASRRDLATACFLVGQLGNEVLNWVLKHAVKAVRPASVLGRAWVPQYGWPSNHCQFMGFSAAYVCLWAGSRWRVGSSWRLLTCATALALAALVAASRLYLGYHDREQVGAGLVIGALAGAAWFGLTELALRPLFPSIVSSHLGRWAWVRDGSNVDVLRAEYEAVQGKRMD
jgi:dolichyldiphosphatase